MSITILRANALALPIADGSVDLVVTSPPYFGLRSYQDGGEHYQGQIGAEATPAEFVDALIAATREMVRVLKPSGSIWVNLGDKYVSDNRGSASDVKRGEAKWAPAGPAGYPGEGIMPRKSLMGIPWRYAIRCIDELGLILRAEVIWSKPNGLPESVTDRVRRSHEQWFHFTKEPRYFSAVDEIREEHKPGQSPSALSFNREGRGTSPGQSVAPHRLGREDQGLNPLGKLPSSVWTVATEPLRVPESLGIDHFAAFPSELPRRIITGWSPREVCTACGEGRRPVSERNPIDPRYLQSNRRRPDGTLNGRDVSTKSILRTGLQAGQSPATHITGYACACPDTSAPTTPGVVLDVFGGTGTTALVADVLGRDAITIDLSADYCRLAQWRTTDPKQRAKAARVEPVDAPSPDQPDLFEESAS